MATDIKLAEVMAAIRRAAEYDQAESIRNELWRIMHEYEKWKHKNALHVDKTSHGY